MIKSKLMKTIMLGLCMSALTTGTAFATEASTPPSTGNVEQSDQSKALYEMQNKIDQYVFKDHAEELIDKGITINYTGVSEEYVEIGISPYSDENVAYLYELFGKDLVKVVDYDESIMYATGVAVGGTEDAGSATDNESSGNETATNEVNEGTEPVTTDEVLTNTDKGAPDAEANDGRVYKDSDVTIQIESADQEENQVKDDVIDPAKATDDSVIYYSAAANGDNAEVQTISAEAMPDAVKRGEQKDDAGMSAPVMILIIAGGAAILGGAVIVLNKKKNVK